MEWSANRSLYDERREIKAHRERKKNNTKKKLNNETNKQWITNTPKTLIRSRRVSNSTAGWERPHEDNEFDTIACSGYAAKPGSLEERTKTTTITVTIVHRLVSQ